MTGGHKQATVRVCNLRLNIFRNGITRGNEPSLLAQAIKLECEAEILMKEHLDVLDAHDESAPFNGIEVGFGKGALAAQIALGVGRAVQRLLEMGEEDVARSRLRRGKKAYEFALGIVEKHES